MTSAPSDHSERSRPISAASSRFGAAKRSCSRRWIVGVRLVAQIVPASGQDREVGRVPEIQPDEGLHLLEGLARTVEEVVTQQDEEAVADGVAPVPDLLGVQPAGDVRVEAVVASERIRVQAVRLDGQRALEVERLDGRSPGCAT